MIVTHAWPKCEYWGGQWGQEPIDGFFVGFTYEEAKQVLMGRVTLRSGDKNADPLSPGWENITSRIWFLISRSGLAVDRCTWHYPIDHMWNGHSPFEPYPSPIEITHLDELQKLELPSQSLLRQMTKETLAGLFLAGHLVFWEELPDQALVVTAVERGISPIRIGTAVPDARTELIEKLRAKQRERMQ